MNGLNPKIIEVDGATWDGAEYTSLALVDNEGKVELNESMYICACTHTLYEHDIMVASSQQNHLKNLFCHKCACKHFATDNLDWLLKNKG